MPLGWLTGIDKRTVSGIMYMYILYVRRQGAVLVNLWTCLPITTTFAGEWLNSSIYHGDINVYYSKWIDDYL